MENTKNRSKVVLAVVLAIALLAAGIIGTYAWLTAQDSATNTFTYGSFNEPENKPDPDNPDEPGTEPSTDGFLIETKWVDKSKLMPGEPIDKNPNVGIGDNSDDAYVFVYVDNKTQTGDTVAANAPYFTLEDGWFAVDADESEAQEGAYTGGLFAYGVSEDELSALSGDAEGYTGEMFKTVTAPADADMTLYAEPPVINVYAYLYGADSAAGDGEPGSMSAAVTAAKNWDTNKEYLQA